MLNSHLAGIREVVATDSAFAAFLGTGEVLAWGRGSCGGDSSRVQHQLVQVRSGSMSQSAV